MPKLKTLKPRIAELSGRTVAQTDNWRDGKSARERGYTRDWEKARAGFLRANPLCVHCWAQGRAKAANTVDHIIDHKGDQGRFWQVENWQPLCASCHSVKTMSENAPT